MDLSFIKHEEPVEYALVLSEDVVHSNEKSCHSNEMLGEFHSMDIYTITTKEEPTDDRTDYLDNALVKTDSEASDYVPDKSENSDDSFSEADSCEETENSSNGRFSKSLNGHFGCDECPAVFSRKKKLLEHCDKHKNLLDMAYCTRCRRFLPRAVQQFHAVLHGPPPYRCKICDKSFMKMDSFRSHRKVHKEKKFQCDICQTLFRSKALLRSHIEVHFVREKTFLCPRCTIGFYRRNTLLRHIKQAHSEGPQRIFKCPNDSCNREFARSGYLKVHKCKSERTVRVRKPAAIKCLSCDLRFHKTSQMEGHMKRVHGEVTKQFYCDKCTKIFRNFHKFVLHNMQNCSRRIKYQCDMCSTSVSEKYKLFGHFASSHQIGELKGISCTRCDKKFSSQSRLAFHLQVHAKHDKNRPSFQCEYCSQLFQFEYSCRFHMNKTCYLRQYYDGIDSIKDAYKCEMCDVTFIQKCGLIEHMKIIHSKLSPSIGSFSCSVIKMVLQQFRCCNENFIGDTFNQQHTPTDLCKFECRKCRIRFANLYSVLTHCSEHTKRVHQCLRHLQLCNKCDRMFKWKSSIPKKLRSEQDRFSLKCKFCKKTFKSKANCNNHVNKCEKRK